MLTKSQKEEIITKLKESLSQNKVLVMADYRGLSVHDMRELKKEVREIGGRMQVAKKTLLNIALKDAGIDFDTRSFAGPLVFVFGPEETGVPKKVWNFSRKNENLKIEGAVLEGQVLNTADTIALAKLLSKEELLAKLVGTIQGPISGFVNVLAGPMRSFVQVLKAVSDNK
jgi:large subunit ribosomal protein L10